jgi:uncharacterized protein YjbI with pentapeptide repeats
MSGVDLSRLPLISANLESANLAGADLTRANLGCANLAGADLASVTLFWTHFGLASYSKATRWPEGGAADTRGYPVGDGTLDPNCWDILDLVGAWGDADE